LFSHFIGPNCFSSSLIDTTRKEQKEKLQGRKKKEIKERQNPVDKVHS